MLGYEAVGNTAKTVYSVIIEKKLKFQWFILIRAARNLRFSVKLMLKTNNKMIRVEQWSRRGSVILR
ncbi:hypothetical protein L8106_14705 [Lyngbya sp. PCC 8106]|nr:hypothetical protein L8106_14705 [Lyngbya sp. PCC 8106]